MTNSGRPYGRFRVFESTDNELIGVEFITEYYGISKPHKVPFLDHPLRCGSFDGVVLYLYSNDGLEIRANMVEDLGE